jgi:hypothetical protein
MLEFPISGQFSISCTENGAKNSTKTYCPASKKHQKQPQKLLQRDLFWIQIRLENTPARSRRNPTERSRKGKVHICLIPC